MHFSALILYAKIHFSTLNQLNISAYKIIRRKPTVRTSA